MGLLWRRINKMSLSKKKKEKINKVIATIVLIIATISFGFPIIWMLITSLIPNDQALVYPPRIIPKKLHLRNYYDALTLIPYFRYLWNTVYIAIVWTTGIVFSSSLTAYGFSRLHWKGRDTFFYIMLSGCNDIQVFLKIMIPLVKPGVAAVVLFCFVAVWNDFLEPLVYINQQSKFTLALGIYNFAAARFSSWPRLMASALEMSLPVVIVFFFVQRTFIQGITLTGIKG